MDFPDACRKVAIFININGAEFKKAVERRARTQERSRFMKQLNSTRNSIKQNAFDEGVNYVRNTEDSFRVPCSICGRPMIFSNRDSNWEEVRSNLYSAFSTWYRISCK